MPRGAAKPRSFSSPARTWSVWWYSQTVSFSAKPSDPILSTGRTDSTRVKPSGCSLRTSRFSQIKWNIGDLRPLLYDTRPIEGAELTKGGDPAAPNVDERREHRCYEDLPSAMRFAKFGIAPVQTSVFGNVQRLA